VCPVLVAGWVLVGVCRLPVVWRMAGRVPLVISQSPKQMSPSATPEQNTPRVSSVASDCPKISGVYFGPPEVL
jgi:hypothetical protein